MKESLYHKLKGQTVHSLSRTAYSPKKLVAISAGVPLALSLVILLVDWLLNQQIGTTGGLGGMDQRAILTTIQSVLRLAQVAVLPFWSMGYVYAMLRTAKTQDAEPSTLLQGFRNWAPVLRLTMLQATLVLAVGFASAQLGSSLFLMTPWAAPLTDQLEALINAGADLSDVAVMEQMLDLFLSSSIIPMLIFVLVIFLALYFLIIYRFRLAEYCLMENPSLGAMKSLSMSLRTMKGHYFDMLRLDLRLIWYHALTVLAVLLLYGDVALEAMGVALPWSADVSLFLFTILSAGGQFALSLWRQNEVTQIYTHAYLTFSCANPDPS